MERKEEVNSTDDTTTVPSNEGPGVAPNDLIAPPTSPAPSLTWD